MIKLLVFIIFLIIPVFVFSSVKPLEEFKANQENRPNEDFNFEFGRAIIELNLCDRICKILGKTGGLNYDLFYDVPPCQCFCTVPGFKQNRLCSEENACSDVCMFNNFTTGGKCINSKCICNAEMSNKKCPFSSSEWISEIKSPLVEIEENENFNQEMDNFGPNKVEAMNKEIVRLCLPNGVKAVNNCNGLENGNYVNPYNCSMYVACKEGKMFNMPCPRHLHFNPYKGAKGEGECDYPNVTKCKQNKITGELVIAPFVFCENEK